MSIITTPALGKRYRCKAGQLKRLRIMLQILGYLGTPERKGSQTYPILKELPFTASGIRVEYNQRFRISIESAMADAGADLEELTDEMTEWRDNMDQYEGLNQSDKYYAVDEVVDTLGWLDIGSIDIPEVVSQLEFFDIPVYDASLMEGRSRYLGRGRRAANIANTLRGVVDIIVAEYQEDVPESVQGFVAELEPVIDELESVDFPTMYG